MEITVRETMEKKYAEQLLRGSEEKGLKDSIKNKIEREFGEKPKDFMVAVVTSAENYFPTDIAILNYLVNTREMKGVYVAMNKPYPTLVKILQNSNIDTDKLFFIDAISGNLGQDEEISNCVFLSNPAAISELGMTVLNLCDEKKADFLLLDSLSTLVIYNDRLDSVKFTHYLITQLRKYGLAGVIMSLDKYKDPEAIKDISMFVDNVIHLK